MSVQLEIHGAVARIVLDRPEALNALNLDALHALRAHLAEVRDRREIRTAIITGAGEKAFCVGADLKSTRESPASYALWRHLVRTYAVQGVQVHDARLVALCQANGVTHILTLNDADFLRYQSLLVALHPQSIP